MPSKQKVSIFWFRRDLRLHDNTGLEQALKGPWPVLPLFIFDTDILQNFDNRQDARLTFIYEEVCRLFKELQAIGSGLLIRHGQPYYIYQQLSKEFEISAVYTNRDYEPAAKKRDQQIANMLKSLGVAFHDYKDQVLFDRNDILSNAGEPYKVFTPYSRRWLELLTNSAFGGNSDALQAGNFIKLKEIPEPPSLLSLGFEHNSMKFPAKTVSNELIRQYDKKRDFPAEDGTSRLSIHLRYGTISIRQLIEQVSGLNQKFLNELIWREFYMMILDHNPQVVEQAFKPAYDKIPWRVNEEDFEKWCTGNTGIPMVDAGMRQMNQTGFMHNRVRMITASFLTKNLLIDWRWGEAYFAEKLLDYELASNNGGWQWAAGSGVDAQPYFRVFNPESQARKYDPEDKYIRRWIPEYGTYDYPAPMVDLKETRQRAIEHYKKHLNA